jgi:hypothetical protein
MSGHHEAAGTFAMAPRMPGGAGRSDVRGVACADCHNPHVTSNRRANAPYAPGLLRGVSGVDRNGASIRSATYEYEVCFKCHADSAPDLSYVPRVISTTNTRLAFDPSNPSYHPVLSMGRNMNIPSIPSRFEPGMSPSVVIYCSTCHADDEGDSRGPHGSSFRPILRERYETADNTPESYDRYALCYRCHDRSSILSDASQEDDPRPLGGSSVSGGGCAVLRLSDPTGSARPARPAGREQIAHLVSFDTSIVRAKERSTPCSRTGGRSREAAISFVMGWCTTTLRTREGPLPLGHERAEKG